MHALELIDKVGDVKVTARESLGIKWLLCNGASFDATDYPDLYALLSEDADAFDSFVTRTDVSLSIGNYATDAFKIIGDYFVVMTVAGVNKSNYATQTIKIAKPGQDFQSVTYSKYIHSISYIEGQYLIAARASQMISSQLFFGWTDALENEPTTWIQSNKSSGIVPETNIPVVKFGDYYVTQKFEILWEKAYTGIAYSTDLQDWEISSISAGTSTAYKVARIEVANNKLIVFTSKYDSSSSVLIGKIYDDVLLTNELVAPSDTRPFSGACKGFYTKVIGGGGGEYLCY